MFYNHLLNTLDAEVEKKLKEPKPKQEFKIITIFDFRVRLVITGSFFYSSLYKFIATKTLYPKTCMSTNLYVILALYPESDSLKNALVWFSLIVNNKPVFIRVYAALFFTE